MTSLSAPWSTFCEGSRVHRIVDVASLAGAALGRLPYIERIVVENLVRRGGDRGLAQALAWIGGEKPSEIEFYPGRVLMHDTTCVPALVDIAALRDCLAEEGKDPGRFNPSVPVDVSVDHSVAVDVFGAADSLQRNMQRERERNRERYDFLNWASGALSNLKVHPPGVGIMHTLNLERLASVVSVEVHDAQTWAAPDTLVGTDSHTPMINGLGILAWGVGGLEAQSVMFGLPIVMRPPEVVGVRLTGQLPRGAMGADLALHLTKALRDFGVGGRFVEFHGPGAASLSAGERAVVANMAPEYGAATGYFPIDQKVIDYLLATGRTPQHAALVGAYCRRAGLWFDPASDPSYCDVLSFDLNAVRPRLAGPRRPQDLIEFNQAPAAMALAEPTPHSKVAIAAITSCTNTTDPRQLIAAGLLARNARRLGLRAKPWVKTSLAPGSPAAGRYLARADLLTDLEALGFAIVGYGCTTCIGNSGDLTDAMESAIANDGAEPVAVISGNRNFPGRIHPSIERAFLASPPLVIAFAIAGDADRDIGADPIAMSDCGDPVFLSDLWPTGDEIDAVLGRALDSTDFAAAYDDAANGAGWKSDASAPARFHWSPASTYLQRPPFVAPNVPSRLGRYSAHPLLVLGDDTTTDHISPAGAIGRDSEAGRYLAAAGEAPDSFNVFAARRGNWEVMLRGLFDNRSVRCLLDPTLPPGQTIHAPSGRVMPVWRAAQIYQDGGDNVIIVAGERYGMGSSRDWAAKGVALCGVRAVLATSFERIHRSNLINMGVLPLRLPAQFKPQDAALRPGDVFEIDADPAALMPRAQFEIRLRRRDGDVSTFQTLAEVETELEAEILRGGGLLPHLLRIIA